MTYGLWIRNYIRHPLTTGALMPSSVALGSLMTAHIQNWQGDYILELGPGTGAVTKALLERNVPENALILIEQSKDFVSHLRQAFPRATVIWGSAAETRRHLFSLGIATVDEIISGIPLVSLGIPTRRVICNEGLSILKSGGSFTQVTYFGFCPIPKDVIKDYSATTQYCGLALRNLPPGFVWRVSRP